MTLPAPVYDHDGITLYHADSWSLIGALPVPDAVLCDPPYGIAVATDYGTTRSQGKGLHDVRHNYAPVHGDDAPFSPAPLFVLWPKAQFTLFGANYFSSTLPGQSGWIVWDKGRGEESDFAQGELAYTNWVKGVRILKHHWDGLCRSSEKRPGDFGLHPTAKPVALFTWILSLRWAVPPGSLVIDPFMGSGPVALACQQLGYRYIGIEIERTYVDIAIQRLAQRSLFSVTEAAHET